MRDVNTVWKMKSGWMSDKWLCKADTAMQRDCWSPRAHDGKPTRGQRVQESVRDRGISTQPQRWGWGVGEIGDTPESLSCPPVKKGNRFSGNTGQRGTRLRDARHSTGWGRHRGRNRGIRERFSSERWDSPAPCPGSAPGPGTAQLILHPTQACTRAEESKMPPCRKCPVERRPQRLTFGGPSMTLPSTLWITLRQNPAIDKPCPHTQSFQQPRNGL